MKAHWKLIQHHLEIPADGIPGPATAEALLKSLNIHTPQHSWPSQEEVRSGTSPFGRAGDEANLVSIPLPYSMRLAWDTSHRVSSTRCHRLVADALTRIFQTTLDHYGMEQIKTLGLDLYGGCFNDRAIIGGKASSMHAWGIAVDMDPERNGLNTHAPRAVFSGPDYEPFWKIVQGEGAVSLGRERDYDWMHFQFATL